jgi:hypothetical protein
MIMMFYPPVSDPALSLMGWTLPAAGNPDIVVALPAVIAIDPHKTTLRRPAALFVHGRRWANADHYLRKRCRREQCESEH